MVKQITIDKPTKPNLFATNDALITTSTTAVDFVTDDLEKLAVELISNNELRVKSGVFCIGGHYGCIQNGTYETCFVSPGNVGFNRKDLIVARYTRVGNLDYIGVQIYTGVPTKGVPVVPSLTVSDLNTGGKIREIALHTVELVDMDIVNVTQVFTKLTKKEELFHTSFFTITGTDGLARHNTKLEVGGIVTQTISLTETATYIDGPIYGVWRIYGAIHGFAAFGIDVEEGYTASDIIAIPSVSSSSIIKMMVKSIGVVERDGIKKIEIWVTPYAFAQVTTAITSDFSVYVRYKKVKL